MAEFYTKIVGVTKEGRERLISRLYRKGLLNPGTSLKFEAEPMNIFDPYAVKVLTSDGQQLGYIKNDGVLNREISNNLRSGRIYHVYVSCVTGGGSDDMNYGINIKVVY